MKTLIVGANTGGIGDALVEVYDPESMEDVLYTPTIEQLDVRAPDLMVEYVLQNGPFDRIVYSAGMSRLGWIKDLRARDLDRAFDVNLNGAILLASAHVKFFPEARVRYAVVVSDAAHTPMRGSIAYCVSKAGLEMAVRCMARELAPLWTVVGVSPGVVEDTPMTNQLGYDIPAFRSWTPAQAREYEDKTNVLGRRVDKQEVAETLLFALTGPEALNGSIIIINGGK
jgi:NAD(P)-dependent dehydrogenase (short-subunit alcohol dehydrogenase family)